jgi:hypothetical protein
VGLSLIILSPGIMWTTARTEFSNRWTCAGPDGSTLLNRVDDNARDEPSGSALEGAAFSTRQQQSSLRVIGDIPSPTLTIVKVSQPIWKLYGVNWPARPTILPPKFDKLDGNRGSP